MPKRALKQRDFSPIASVKRLGGWMNRRVLPRRRQCTHAGIEALEPRCLLSAVTWIGSGADNLWSTASNWSGGAVPATGDDVSIASGFPAITIASGTAALHSLASASPLTLTGGTLSVAGSTAFTANLTLQGGTIQNTDVSFAGAELVVRGIAGNLTNVTVNGDLDMSQQSGTNAYVLGGLRIGPSIDPTPVPGRILIGSALNWAHLIFDGTSPNGQTLAPAPGQSTLEVLMGGGSNAIENSISYSDNTGEHGGPVIFAPGVTIDGPGGRLDSFSGGEFLNYGSISSNSGGELDVTGPLYNAGIVKVTDQSALNLYSINGNLGTVSPVSDPSTLTVVGAYVVNQPITLAGGATLTLEGSWTNAGTITETSSILNLGGSFAPSAIGTIIRPSDSTAGKVNLTGNLQNMGTTLGLNDTTGPWNLAGGSINGGTVTESGSGQLIVLQPPFSGLADNTNNLLNGVMIDGNLDLSQAKGAYAQVQGGLTIGPSADPTPLPGRILIGNASGSTYGNLAFTGSSVTGQTLSSGPGEQTLDVIMGGTSDAQGGSANDEINNDIQYRGSGGNSYGAPVTFAAGVLVHGKNGLLNGLSNVYPGQTFINDGTLDADGGGTLTVIAGLTSPGTLGASNGSTLIVEALSGDVGNQGTLEAKGGTLSVASMTNFSGGTLTGGTYEALAGGNLVLPGAITTDAATLVLDGAGSMISSGSFNALAGLSQIAAGGSLSLSNGQSLSIAPMGGTLTNKGAIELNQSTFYVNYAGGADPVNTLRGYLAAGYNGGAWNGAPTPTTGVITTSAGNGAYGIGYADSADGTGTNPVANTVVLKYTVLGDANLDGTVNLADFLAVSRHFGQSGGWDAGDFNYDGTTNLADLLTVVRHFGQSLPPTLSATDLLLPSSSDSPRLATRRTR